MKPARTQLQCWYLDEKMSAAAIALRCSASKSAVKKWLHEYGIPTRPAGSGHAHHGKPVPTADDLYRLIHLEHLGYREIARRYNATLNAAHQWVRKYNIARPTVWETRRKGRAVVLPNKAKLQSLYDSGLSGLTIAGRYGVSPGHIYALCERYGIERRPNGWNGGRRFACQDGHSVRSTYEQRVDDWLSAHNVPHEYEPRLFFDKRSRADFLANGWYIEIWGVKDSALYLARKRRKLGLYRSHNVPLIHFTPDAFRYRRNTWGRILVRCLTPPAPSPLTEPLWPPHLLT